MARTTEHGTPDDARVALGWARTTRGKVWLGCLLALVLATAAVAVRELSDPRPGGRGTASDVAAGGAATAGDPAPSPSAAAPDGDDASRGSRVPPVAPARAPGEPMPAGFTRIASGTDLSAALSFTAGRYWLEPGRYRLRGSVYLMSGTTVTAGPGTIVDGDGRDWAFHVGDGSRPGTRDVTIRNLVLENFGNPDQFAAISSSEADGLLLEDVELRNNASWGAFLGRNSVARRVWAHHNGQGGIKAWADRWGPTDTVVVEDSELNDNNTRRTDSSFEAGGSKMVGVANVTFRRNFVHGNVGSPGYWCDYCGAGNVIEDNTFSDNGEIPVELEMTLDTVVRHNTIDAPVAQVTREGGWGGAVYAFNTRNLTVTANRMTGGVVGFAKYRGATDFSDGTEVRLTGLRVTDNDITLPEGSRTGVKVDANSESSSDRGGRTMPATWVAGIFDPTLNRWAGNTYRTSARFDWGRRQGSDNPWEYALPDIDLATWQQYGQDVAGRVTP